jgi:hypothetical protein
MPTVVQPMQDIYDCNLKQANRLLDPVVGEAAWGRNEVSKNLTLTRQVDDLDVEKVKKNHVYQ